MPTPVRWTPELVAAAEDPNEAFSLYCQQQLGVPWPTVKDKTIMKKKINDLFATTPQADWFTLCRTVQYCKSRRRRFERVWMVVEMVREAYGKGLLPELAVTEDEAAFEAEVEKALEVEDRPDWRARLLGARSSTARRSTLEEWKLSRG